jgi:hypothetical protein
MLFRRATDEDLASILALQEANLLPNLDAEQRKQGFLSARFSAEQFALIARDVALIVAADGPHLAGYMCASSLAFNREVPLLAAMIEAFPQTPFLGQPLASQRCVIYGPVCVDRAHRNRGVLRGMYEVLRREIAGEYDAGVLFISRDNERSLAAHADGLGMHLVGDFSFGGRGYRILAFAVPAAPFC